MLLYTTPNYTDTRQENSQFLKNLSAIVTSLTFSIGRLQKDDNVHVYPINGAGFLIWVPFSWKLSEHYITT